MSTPPLIGITGRRKKGSDVNGVLAVQGELDIDLFFTNYGRQVRMAGGMPVLIPRDSNAEVVSKLDGVVLSGGADVDPAIHSPEEDPGLSKFEPGRDSHEFEILNKAIEKDVPVLGICRGIQVINVHAGGTLFQDIPDHANIKKPYDDRHHKVRFKAGSILSDIYGSEIEVNSLHHQAINKIAEGIEAVGWSSGGEATEEIIEAIEVDGRRILAVQWHPELLPGADPIFSWLIDQATK
jgi:gamma-glutamyl-gamma-aminobutyrate hydrolase PuuD